MDQACDDDGLTRVRDGRERRDPDVAIAEQIGSDRCSYHPDDDRQPSCRTNGDQNPRSHSRGWPEYGNAIDRLQQGKAQARRKKIGQRQSNGRNGVGPLASEGGVNNAVCFAGAPSLPSARPG